MTQTDICNAPIGLDDGQALVDWNAMVLAFLAHKPQTPEHLGAVLKAAPEFAMAHAARGLFSLMMGKAELVSVARDALAAAQSGDTSSPRERLWVAALAHWLNGSPTRAIASIEEVLSQYPQDSLSAKVSQGIRFILGDATGMRRSIERVLPAHGENHPCAGYMIGCHAFTLEETGDYDAALRTGLQGLERTSDDAWGLHAVAHVYDMTARPDVGIALIENNAAAWDGSNNFRYHVWWHKALLHLDLGEFDVALGLYDAQIRQDKTDDYRDIANATSLLTRLELDGVKVGHRWEELALFSQKRVGDGCLVFADLHYMLALSGADRGSAKDQMMQRFSRDAKEPGEMNKRVADPGLAAIAGLNAFAEGRYGAAFADLATARTSMQSIGGSHAQRDVFERMTIDAGLRAGHFEATENILSQRLALRGGHADRFTVSRFDKLAASRRIPAE